MTAPSHHRIKSLSVVGGFLDGLRFDFSDALNCFIGARGTGKTTALEFVGYALDNLPGRERTPEERKRIESLIRQNLGGGRVQLMIETRDGLAYTVSRTWGEEPIILTAEGEPTELTLKTGGVFKADVYSQNEVESIADRPMFQLDLIDNFAADRVADIAGQLRQVETALKATAHRIGPLQSEIAALREEAATLAGVEEKLKKFTAEVGTYADEINEAHQLKALRDREGRFVEAVREVLSDLDEELQRLSGRIGDRARALIDDEVSTGPNEPLVREILDSLNNCGRVIDQLFQEARRVLGAQQGKLAETAARLVGRHKSQELEFRKLIEKHAHAQEQASERAELEKRRNDLLAKRRRRDERERQLVSLQAERRRLLEGLSELRDQRFAVREEVAEQINRSLSPAIRVSILQCGNPECYQQLLENVLKGAGVKQGLVAQKLVNALSPAELADFVRQRERRALVDKAELNADQAEKVVVALSDPAMLFELETVDLVDLPRIELKDGEEYKDALSLSTGQKCTTILPILLLDSDNPLLIDQPEDNLDNRFIFETVVESIRGVKQRRQLIFVTHNPNIPVLGDAAKVFVLESDGVHARKSNEGTVDRCKDEIVTLLEGGKEAFKRRRERYAY